MDAPGRTTSTRVCTCFSLGETTSLLVAFSTATRMCCEEIVEKEKRARRGRIVSLGSEGESARRSRRPEGSRSVRGLIDARSGDRSILTRAHCASGAPAPFGS